MKKLFLCTVYRAESNTDVSFGDKLQETIDTVRSLYNPMLLICGDLNADFASKHGRLLVDFTLHDNLEYHTTDPTRITETSAAVPGHIKFPNIQKRYCYTSSPAYQ